LVDGRALALQPSKNGGSDATVPEAPRGSFLAPSGIDILGRTPALRAEQRLLLAVLEEAVRTFQRYLDGEGRRSRRLLREVEAWFASDDPTFPFSFVPLCDALGLDPSYLRSGLRRWRASHRFPIRTVYRLTRPAVNREVGGGLGGMLAMRDR
jgi:hypothetical protein